MRTNNWFLTSIVNTWDKNNFYIAKALYLEELDIKNFESISVNTHDVLLINQISPDIKRHV